MIEIRGYSEACESDIITNISESHAEGIKNIPRLQPVREVLLVYSCFDRDTIGSKEGKEGEEGTAPPMLVRTLLRICCLHPKERLAGTIRNG